MYKTKCVASVKKSITICGLFYTIKNNPWLSSILKYLDNQEILILQFCLLVTKNESRLFY